MDVADVRLAIAMRVYPKMLHFEVIQARGEHRPISFAAAAEDAFRAADALLEEARPAQTGPRDLDAPISVEHGVPDTMVTMPPCAPGQRFHREGPGGRCVWCGIEIGVVRNAVIRNQNRFSARARRQAKTEGAQIA